MIRLVAKGRSFTNRLGHTNMSMLVSRVSLTVRKNSPGESASVLCQVIEHHLKVILGISTLLAGLKGKEGEGGKPVPLFQLLYNEDMWISSELSIQTSEIVS